MKKISKLYHDFLASGEKDEDFDIKRKAHRCRSYTMKADMGELIQDMVKPWMDGVARGRPYVWQLDGAPAHNANRTQDWCRANLPHFWEKELWPPSSPDVNPLDFFVWGVAERDTKRSPTNTKESLIRSIKNVFINFHREDVVHACSQRQFYLINILFICEYTSPRNFMTLN